MIYYAGIGARKTPQNVLNNMGKLANYLSKNGCTLRSGGADGADTAFANGATQNIKVYLPWGSFNIASVMKSVNVPNTTVDSHVCEDALKLASKYHPNWDACSQGARKLMGRNMYQILGKSLVTPVSFVACWTPEGKIVGGTGQALRVAQDYDIEIINFGNTSLDAIEKRILEIT